MFNPGEIKVVDLDTLTMNSDFISLHVPMLDSTRNLFDYHRISKMKSTARLINVARGGIINEKDALKKAVSYATEICMVNGPRFEK